MTETLRIADRHSYADGRSFRNESPPSPFSTHQEKYSDGDGLLLEVAAARALLLPHHGDHHQGETHQTEARNGKWGNLRLNPYSSLSIDRQLFLLGSAHLSLLGCVVSARFTEPLERKFAIQGTLTDERDIAYQASHFY